MVVQIVCLENCMFVNRDLWLYKIVNLPRDIWLSNRIVLIK